MHTPVFGLGHRHLPVTSEDATVSLIDTVRNEFLAIYHEPPAIIVRAPGRVNLIGEHTDYNEGYVLPMAIDRAIWIALRFRQDTMVAVRSLDFGQSASFRADSVVRGTSSWVEYLKGIAWAMADAGYALRGWEGVLTGDVPLGAGLSSSAALELAVARAFAAASDLPWEAKAMASICQRAENEWVGMQCGIMDQMVSAAGQADHALLIDCRSLQTKAVLLPPGTAIVVLDTGTRRGLIDSAYNERRAQCEAAARSFGVPALRDVSIERFERDSALLAGPVRRCARHVVTENARTLKAARAMSRGDGAELGQLMDESHTSMRDDFEISSAELDAMVACARRQGACLGARMTGGGFAGCAVALVLAEEVERFSTQVAACYQENTGLSPEVYVCTASDGAGVVSER